MLGGPLPLKKLRPTPYQGGFFRYENIMSSVLKLSVCCVLQVFCKAGIDLWCQYGSGGLGGVFPRTLGIKGFIPKVTVLGSDGTCWRCGLIGGGLENFFLRKDLQSLYPLHLSPSQKAKFSFAKGLPGKSMSTLGMCEGVG